MAKTKISEFSATPGNNTDIDGINIAEGCAPSGINDAIRELMAQLKDWQAGTSNDPYVVGSSGSLTLSYGTANGVPYLNGSKVLTSGSALTFDGTNLGIGTSSPGTRLDVSGNLRFSAANPVIEFNNGGAQVYSTVANTLQFASGGGIGSPTERMRIDSSGNVGIGTSSPLTKFTVSGGYISQTDGTVRTYLGADGSGGALVGTTTNQYLRFITNDTERARIDSSGNLLVGTTSAEAKFCIKTASSDNTTKAVQFRNSANTELLAILSNGAIYTGTAAASPYNNTTGTAVNMVVGSDGSLYRSTSSLRYKTNVLDATYGLADVLKLRPVTYQGKNDGDTVFGGLIAEEVHEAGLTQFVTYDSQGRPDALAYGNMVSLCIKAIQEQQAIITALTARVTALEAA